MKQRGDVVILLQFCFSFFPFGFFFSFFVFCIYKVVVCAAQQIAIAILQHSATLIAAAVVVAAPATVWATSD